MGIAENEKVQGILALMIEDFQSSQSESKESKSSPQMPEKEDSRNGPSEYMRDIFSHYCMEQKNASFYGIGEIQKDLIPELKRLLLRDDLVNETEEKHEEESNIDDEKVKRLFPNLLRFTDDLNQEFDADGTVVRPKLSTYYSASRAPQISLLSSPELKD